MPHNIAPAHMDEQPAAADPRDRVWSASADLERWLDLLREAMRDTGWTVDALARHWDINRAYAWRLVQGEKPWTLERVLSLPDDLEGRLEHLRAEAFGRIVVERTSGEDAMRSLVSGLVGVLSDRLPAKADRLVKAEIVTAAKKAGER